MALMEDISSMEDPAVVPGDVELLEIPEGYLTREALLERCFLTEDEFDVVCQTLGVKDYNEFIFSIGTTTYFNQTGFKCRAILAGLERKRAPEVGKNINRKSDLEVEALYRKAQAMGFRTREQLLVIFPHLKDLQHLSTLTQSRKYDAFKYDEIKGTHGTMFDEGFVSQRVERDKAEKRRIWANLVNLSRELGLSFVDVYNTMEAQRESLRVLFGFDAMGEVYIRNDKYDKAYVLRILIAKGLLPESEDLSLAA